MSAGSNVHLWIPYRTPLPGPPPQGGREEVRNALRGVFTSSVVSHFDSALAASFLTPSPLVGEDWGEGEGGKHCTDRPSPRDRSLLGTRASRPPRAGRSLSLSKAGGCGGRGDIGVRFDRLNELRGGKVPELAERISPKGYRIQVREISRLILYGIPPKRYSDRTNSLLRPDRKPPSGRVPRADSLYRPAIDTLPLREKIRACPGLDPGGESPPTRSVATEREFQP